MAIHTVSLLFHADISTIKILVIERKYFDHLLVGEEVNYVRISENRRSVRLSILLVIAEVDWQ